MDPNIATEISYKNGFTAGEQNSEITTRVEVAYEQLSKCHTKLCRTSSRDENNDLICLLQDAMQDILNIQVKLGVFKRARDLK